MNLPKSLLDFFAAQKTRYAELFWHAEQKGKVVLMIEKLAQQARKILTQEGALSPEIVSFENDDSVGEFYLVEDEQVDVATRPSREEYRSILDKDLKTDFTDQTNDIYQNQLIRIFKPVGYNSFCAVAYHSFALLAPRGPVGWLKNLKGLKKVGKPVFSQPENFISLEDSCQRLEGTRYQIGGGSVKNGFDCSSLIQKIFYETHGIWLPRKARWQATICNRVEQKDIKQKDLVFFNKKGEPEIDHVALVYEVKNGKLPVVFHAKRILGKAMFEDLNKVSWLDRWEVNMFGRIDKDKITNS